jgi:hypothetical protein
MRSRPIGEGDEKVFIVFGPENLRRKPDPRSGLALIDLGDTP